MTQNRRTQLKNPVHVYTQYGLRTPNIVYKRWSIRDTSWVSGDFKRFVLVLGEKLRDYFSYAKKGDTAFNLVSKRQIFNFVTSKCLHMWYTPFIIYCGHIYWTICDKSVKLLYGFVQICLCILPIVKFCEMMLGNKRLTIWKNQKLRDK